MANIQPLEAMQSIIDRRGTALSRDDLREIDWLTTQLPIDDAFDQRGWIDEAIALIVSGPGYEGDIAIDDLASD